MHTSAAAVRRRELLLRRAAEFARVTIKNVRAEFPNDMLHVMHAPGDSPQRPRDLFPAFYGCFDWHSCVQMHWLLVRLLRAAPDVVPEAEIRAVLGEHLTADALAGEARTFTARHGGRSRPYGWGWALTLIHELATWDDPDAKEWASNAQPLADAITEEFLRWLPKATYPIRQGAHPNTAWGMSRALAYARARAVDDSALLTELTEAAFRWYIADRDYPGEWEPSGADFLSPALAEAELMAGLLPAADFLAWFNGFLPGVAEGRPHALFVPAVASDDSDGQIAHLHGLNLSRAWCWRRIAESLPADDPRVPRLLDAAAAHAEPELDEVSGSDYMVEHWLACYAVLYLS